MTAEELNKKHMNEWMNEWTGRMKNGSIRVDNIIYK